MTDSLSRAVHAFNNLEIQNRVDLIFLYSRTEFICASTIAFLYVERNSDITYKYDSKVGDRSQGRPKGSLFNSYYTEV